MNENIINRKLDKIINAIQNQMVVRKKVLSMKEASIYLGVSISDLYKKTSKGEITFYKPNGKRIYFRKADLVEWMLQNKNITDKSIKTKKDD